MTTPTPQIERPALFAPDVYFWAAPKWYSPEAVHAYADICTAAKDAEIERLTALAETLKLEAQTHAQEARTANATIAEIYQVVTGCTGEPGNWHGARPVRMAFEALAKRVAELEAAQTEAYAEGRGDQWKDDCAIVQLLLENCDDADQYGDGQMNTTRIRELVAHFAALPPTQGGAG